MKNFSGISNLANENGHIKNNASSPDTSPKQATSEHILCFGKSAQSQPKFFSKVITVYEH